MDDVLKRRANCNEAERICQSSKVNGAMMRVLFINPPLHIRYVSNYFNDILGNLFYNSSPLGLCYLASYLENKGVDARIIDAPVERLDYPAVIGRMRSFDPDVVGITSTTCNFASAVTLAGMIKREKNHTPVVIGGPHATVAPAHALTDTPFDAAVVGEGELTFADFIDRIEHHQDIACVDGLAFKRNGSVIVNKPREFIKNLDILPYPARHLLRLDLYRPQFNDEYVLPKATMISSRGCPYQCIFCEKGVWGPTYRSFGADYIASEMKYLVDTFGVRDIAFVDSLFTASAERVLDIVHKIKSYGVKVRWTCTVRANIATYELLKAMKEAGCWRVRIGIESGDDRVLAFIKKGITTSQVRAVVRWAHKLGLQPKGFFMVGHLVDTPDTIERTIKFAKSLPLKDVTVQVNTPMIDTAQYKIMNSYGSLLTSDYSAYSYWEPVFVPAGLTKEYLLNSLSRFYRSFYLRPIVIWRHIIEIRHWYNIVRYARAARLICHLFFARFNRKDATEDKK
jgi:anaerobic magnesium-protoporphyrin IX monomethyl ester cyclase